MGVGAGLYMYFVVVQKFTFAMSSPDEFLFISFLLFSFSFILVIFFKFVQNMDFTADRPATQPRETAPKSICGR